MEVENPIEYLEEEANLSTRRRSTAKVNYNEEVSHTLGFNNKFSLYLAKT